MEALSLQGDKVQAVPVANERQFITEYLLTEILNQQIPEVQAFLLHTAILDQFSLSLCRAIISEEASRLLSQIQSPIFLSPGWRGYQYHPLFREFLRAQLENKSPERGGASQPGGALVRTEWNDRGSHPAGVGDRRP